MHNVIFKQEFYTRQIKIQMLYAKNTDLFVVHVSAMFRISRGENNQELKQATFLSTGTPAGSK